MKDRKFFEILERLGQPDLQVEGIAIYNKDCLNAMREIPTDHINLTITSPPYNIGKEYEEIIKLEDYIYWCEQWIEEIHRITTNDGAFWLNVGYLEVPRKGLAVPIPYLIWGKTSFYFLQEVVWNYGAGVACSKRLSPRNEKLLWYVKNPEKYTFNLNEIRDPNVKYPNQKKNGKLKCNPIGKNPSDVWQIAKVTSGKNRASKERTPHPAQFPIEMIERIIKACCHPGEIVLDPFIGSGTTAECAIQNGRHAIGFEIEEAYIELIEKRLLHAIQKRNFSLKQQELFLNV